MALKIRNIVGFVIIGMISTCLTGCMRASAVEYSQLQSHYITEDVAESEGKDPIAMEDRFSDRLTIPSVGVDVALYACSSLPDDCQQEIVDAEDSAAYQEATDFQAVPGDRFIADHNYRGFTAIRNVILNETKAYITKDGKVEEYTCIAVGLGENTGSELVDWNGVSLNYDYIVEDLAMYTCNESWESVTITYWERTEENDVI